MTIKNTLLLTLLTGLLTTAFTCKSPTGSDDGGNNEPDTTSQNFTYFIDTLGGYSTHIYCIEIVNDTLIYVGGSITPFGHGTTNQDYKTYNLAIWNGKDWKLENILFQGEAGPTDKSPQTIRAIKAFENGNVFILSDFNSIAMRKNLKWTTVYPVGSGDKARMWARSENDIYFVGSNGSATHYNGTTFTKLATGTTADLKDLWGNDKFLYATGEGESGADQQLLEHDGTMWKVINRYNFKDSTHDPIYENIGLTLSVYVTEKNNVYLNGGQGFGEVRKMINRNPFRTEILHDFLDYYIERNEPFFARRIRGNADNDIYASSSNGAKFYHFNGKRWKLFETPSELAYWSLNLTVKGKIWVNSLEPDLGITRIIMGKRF